MIWVQLLAHFPNERIKHREIELPAQGHRAGKRQCVSHSVIPTLYNPMDCIAHQAHLPMGILQVRILEWVAIPFSRGSS